MDSRSQMCSTLELWCGIEKKKQWSSGGLEPKYIIVNLLEEAALHS